MMNDPVMSVVSQTFPKVDDTRPYVKDAYIIDSPTFPKLLYRIHEDYAEKKNNFKDVQDKYLIKTVMSECVVPCPESCFMNYQGDPNTIPTKPLFSLLNSALLLNPTAIYICIEKEKVNACVKRLLQSISSFVVKKIKAKFLETFKNFSESFNKNFLGILDKNIEEKLVNVSISQIENNEFLMMLKKVYLDTFDEHIANKGDENVFSELNKQVLESVSARSYTDKEEMSFVNCLEIIEIENEGSSCKTPRPWKSLFKLVCDKRRLYEPIESHCVVEIHTKRSMQCLRAMNIFYTVNLQRYLLNDLYCGFHKLSKSCGEFVKEYKITHEHLKNVAMDGTLPETLSKISIRDPPSPQEIESLKSNHVAYVTRIKKIERLSEICGVYWIDFEKTLEFYKRFDLSAFVGYLGSPLFNLAEKNKNEGREKRKTRENDLPKENHEKKQKN